MQDEARAILERLGRLRPRERYFVPESIIPWTDGLVVYAVTKTFAIDPETLRVTIEGHNVSPFLIGFSVESDTPFPCGYELSVTYRSAVGGWGKQFGGSMIPKLHSGEMTLLGSWPPVPDEDAIELGDELAREMKAKMGSRSSVLTVQRYAPGSFDLTLRFPHETEPPATGVFTIYGLARIEAGSLRIPKANN